MTVGIATKVNDEFILAVDSRTTSGTYKHNNTNKLHKLGYLSIIAAGDVGQIQRAVRTAGEEVGESIEEFIAHIEECGVSESEWIVCDGCQLYYLTPGEGGSVAHEVIEDGSYVVIGSGGWYVQGYLDACPHPQNKKQALRLFYLALHSCSERFLCVGGPFRCRVIKERLSISQPQSSKEAALGFMYED